jgi:opacity protein-like surface antigen
LQTNAGATRQALSLRVKLHKTMKTKICTLSVIVAGMAWSASAQTQAPPPAPYEFDEQKRAVVRVTGHYVIPDDDFSEEWGVSVAIGNRLDAQHRFEGEFGYARWTHRQAGANFDTFANARIYPMLMNYKFNVLVGDRTSIYFGPSAGTTYQRVSANETRVDSGERLRGSDTDWSFTWGGGIGLVFHGGERASFDIGYRFLRLDSPSYDLGPIGRHDLRDQDAHIISAGMNFRF